MSSAEAATLAWIIPDWPTPPWVRAYTTTRVGGVSLPPYDSLNLADHVGDAAQAVAANRTCLIKALALPAEPLWLNQAHGARVVEVCGGSVAGSPVGEAVRKADAVYTEQPDVVCAVLSGDCLPLLLCDRGGTRVAAVHAGWRGLAAGVIEAAMDAIQRPAQELMAWLGPAIGPHAFEVGDEVREIFVRHESRAAQAFHACRMGQWWMDIYKLARMRLNARGVARIYGGHWCTLSDAGRFYSYRRDGVTGRMATLIWLAGQDRV